MPVASLVVDIGLFNLSVVVLELHEDLAILFVVGEAGFLLELVSPKVRIVTPATSESVNTVRVSHFDESDAVAKPNNTMSCEGMTEVQTITVSVRVVGACSSSLHNVMSAVMELKLLPKGINVQSIVHYGVTRSTRKSLDGHQRIA